MSTLTKDNMLGKEYRDKITGFTGTVTAFCSYLTGCDQVGLTPKVNAEGKTQPSEWFDIGRVEFIGDGITAKSVQAEKNGGPNRDAPQL